MAERTRHALTGDEYQAEGPDAVRVWSGERWGLFDGHGGWIEGELRQCDPQMCIWLAGLARVEERNRAAAQASENAR